MFGERVISRNGPVGWQPRSCDLTPLDHIPWSYVKYMVYANKPATIDELRANIERKIAAVSVDLCLKSSKIAFSIWTSASMPVLAMQKKSNFLSNGVERTFTGMKNFIDIRNRFCFI